MCLCLVCSKFDASSYFVVIILSNVLVNMNLHECTMSVQNLSFIASMLSNIEPVLHDFSKSDYCVFIVCFRNKSSFEFVFVVINGENHSVLISLLSITDTHIYSKS